MPTRIAQLEVKIQVLDRGEPRTRWNGDPMASQEATGALLQSVEALQDFLDQQGVTYVHTGYGVTAFEV